MPVAPGQDVRNCQESRVRLVTTGGAELYLAAVPAGIVGGMTEMTVSDARARLADVVDAARVGHDPVYLTRRGQRVAAVIDADDLDRLIAAAEDLADLKAAQSQLVMNEKLADDLDRRIAAAEDLADLQAARAARAEITDGESAILWEQVKADLGLA